VPDPLSLARLRALRLVAVPWAEEELVLLQDTAAAAGRRLIGVAGDQGARALMLGWPADVDPIAVLGADGEDLASATPTTCLVLAACIGCSWPDPEAPLLPGIPVSENHVLDALASFTRPGRLVGESLLPQKTHWRSAIRRLRACGFLVTEEGGSLIRLGPALAGWGGPEVRHLRDRFADLPRQAAEQI
jgi:hypothetical protein